jgi:hypothetical protein
MRSRFLPRLLAFAVGYALLWGFTATVGVSSVRRAALSDPFFGRARAGCLTTVPSSPPTPSVCYAAVFSPVPFVVRAQYGLSGVDVGWGVRQTSLWLLGIRVPLHTTKWVI